MTLLLQKNSEPTDIIFKGYVIKYRCQNYAFIATHMYIIHSCAT